MSAPLSMRKPSFKKILLSAFCSLAVFALCVNAFAATIVIYGDSQNFPKVERKVVAAIQKWQPSIVFQVGDLTDNGNIPKLWKLFDEIHGPLMRSAEYFPALGNHEFDSPLYFEHFPFLHGRRWYSVDRAGIHFIVLDSNSDMTEGSKQYQWLTSDLEGVGADTRFVIAFFHHPLFGVGAGHDEDEKGLKPILLPLFEKYRVSAVFCGHEHNYQRAEYHGIPFIITGGAGSRLTEKVRNNPYLKKYIKVYHFCVLTPSEDSLRVRVLDLKSNVIDEFTIPPR